MDAQQYRPPLSVQTGPDMTKTHYHHSQLTGPQTFGQADPRSEKELRQKRFAEELQAQIRARDEIRVKE
jgi:hypothetical protein